MKHQDLGKDSLLDKIRGVLLLPIIIPMTILSIIGVMLPYSPYHDFLLKHGSERQKAKVRAKREESERIFRVWERDEEWRLEHEGGKH